MGIAISRRDLLRGRVTIPTGDLHKPYPGA